MEGEYVKGGGGGELPDVILELWPRQVAERNARRDVLALRRNNSPTRVAEPEESQRNLIDCDG
jgi:hypothetical protein